jgi:hypothetical protein
MSDKAKKFSVLSDRELLELAAKAVGYDTSHQRNGERLLNGINALVAYKNGRLVATAWNPLEDDGNALKLAVDLSLQITIDADAESTKVADCGETIAVQMWFDGGAHAATRRAIVRTAARLYQRREQGEPQSV